eukprot:CAMPEP_0119105246 /NCGR_PEP_ID=MMETSP1180-20130426/3268_1 /TAXON_ID=3052 ORGANISM="Chlamydomonas cf sp, Strain CCMP681" /NCGR_SAMPLE_ID=MMETSP1180 /ASSEMBLY_ACC=CAM_ASM_000741 /LENGTH=52 /DNA_ID=CAMNT_0007090253 /DNA_START=51 /DNA_END=209 /DNA_ORIENTATION=+
MGFQWERYEAWRHHPLLKINKSNLVPGLRIGLALVVVVKIVEASTSTDTGGH